jgi:hypothetical protein
MKIYQAVQTQEQAKQIIIDSFESDNTSQVINHYGMKMVDYKFKDGVWSNSSCQCDCGQTSLLKYNANSVDGDSMIQYAVGICSSCGTDTPSISAVVNINIW